MVAVCRPLVEVLSEVPDPRKQRGKRHPLVAILVLSCAAVLAGYRSYSAIAEWGNNYGSELVQAIGFTRGKTPCARTLCNVLGKIDRDALEEKLSQWAESIVAGMSTTENLSDTENPLDKDEAVAIDGKTLRGSRKQGAPGAHLLSALSHRLGITVAQRAVDDKTNEITAIFEVLHGLLLEGRVFTMDAMHTHPEVSKTIIDGKSDYVMIVKGNQPELLADIELVFQEPELLADTMSAVQTLDIGHGRIEHRRLTASTALVGYSDWPGLQQVFKVERTVTIKKTGEGRAETVYGITSCKPERADAVRLLGYTRHHWHIENKSHHVRDVTFDEDRSQVRSGNIPQVMAALRNTAIGMMRQAGEANIARACRRFAAQPWAALALVGIQRTIA